jgi:hypothetical protein
MYRADLIRKPLHIDDIRYKDGSTGDIIETVLYADKKAAWYTEKFAPTLKGKTQTETCKNIWQFIKGNIQYNLDPVGQQLIKSPGKLWQENRMGKPNVVGGDCKSFSVFAASCLRNLGIPYGFRFASYRDRDGNVSMAPTHVYVFVPVKDGAEIIIDAVWDGPFNSQKAYGYKTDYLQNLSAIGSLRTIKKPRGFLQYE